MLCDEPKVILGSWPTPSDEWTEEHVLQNTESRAVNLVFNRTLSLQRLANRRADVVVFADAPLDSKSYFLSFGRVAPVQARPIVCLGRSGGVGDMMLGRCSDEEAVALSRNGSVLLCRMLSIGLSEICMRVRRLWCWIFPLLGFWAARQL